MNVALHPIHGLELFSGTGMLGEGFRAGIGHLGITYRTVCHVEREAYAAAVLVARMEEGSLDAAPIWSDVTTFDASAWRGKVDCIIAGFPCQDLSVAGRRAGLDGKRSGLFFEVTRIATDSGAWLMLLENVAGIATATATVVDSEEGELEERAASRVVGELADLGWDAEWITLPASDVGASHERARWFCLAWRMGDTGLQYLDLQQRSVRAEYKTADCVLGDTNQQREQQPHYADGTEPREWSRTCACGAAGELAHPCITGLQRRELGTARDSHRWGQETHGSTSKFCGLFAPGPSDPRWAAILREHPHLAPALEPAFRCVVDGLAFDMGDSRAARLKCVGNGVVALQCAAAVVVLARRAGIF